jgi:hypothetical protein
MLLISISCHRLTTILFLLLFVCFFFLTVSWILVLSPIWDYYTQNCYAYIFEVSRQMKVFTSLGWIPKSTIYGCWIFTFKRMMERVNSTMIYLIYYKNFCKCHNVPPPRTTIKKKKKELPQVFQSHYIISYSNRKSECPISPHPHELPFGIIVHHGYLIDCLFFLNYRHSHRCTVIFHCVCNLCFLNAGDNERLLVW